jgi:hypothetical protein
MRRRRGKRVLRIRHSRAEWNEQKSPAPGRFLQEKFADEPASEKKHHHVNEMEKTERLDLGKVLLVRDDCRHDREQDSVDGERLAKQLHGAEAVTPRESRESNQNGEWSEQAQPLIPGPIAEEKIGTRLKNGVILRRDRRKQAARKVWNPFRKTDGNRKQF